MKKKIIVGMLVVSALSFGAKNNGENQKRGHNKKAMKEKMMSKLTDSQKVELEKTMKDRKEANHKKELDIKLKKVELEKELSNDTKNWNNIEKLNKEIADMKADMTLDRLKFQDEVEKKYGIKMKHDMRNHGGRGHGMKDKKNK